MGNRKPILQVNRLSMDFGGVRTMDQLGLDVRKEEIVALIGPNGAGKSTTLISICGITPPTAGRNSFRREEIQNMSPV